MIRDEREYKKRFFQPAGECDPTGKMPVGQLIQQLIDMATLHANNLGFGMGYLSPKGYTWILGKIALKINELPSVNSEYEVTTYVSSFGTLTTERSFVVSGVEDGRVMAEAQTVWLALNTETRRPGSLVKLFPDGLPVADREAPDVELPSRIEPVGAGASTRLYTIEYSDLDCNRHTTTRRYIELMFNCFGPKFYEAKRLVRLDVAFHAETLWGEEVGILNEELAEEAGIYRLEIKKNNNTMSACRALAEFHKQDQSYLDIK